MHLIPASADALRQLAQSTPVDLAAEVELLAASVQRLVPSCVEINLTFAHPDLTFTLTAGPAAAPQDGARAPEPGRASSDPDRTPLGTDSPHAAGPAVRTTLSLPVTRGGELTGTIHVHAADPAAFDTTAPALRDLTGAGSSLRSTGTDLSSSSRERAEHAPGSLEDSALVHQAVGRLVAAHRIAPDVARSCLYDRAARDRVPLLDVARTVARGGDTP